MRTIKKDPYQLLKIEPQTTLSIPLFLSPVHCGFPNPATDFQEKSLDMNELCIQHPESTYFFRVEGDSMVNYSYLRDNQIINSRIDDGDILVVDSLIEPVDGQVIIAFSGDGYVVRRIKRVEQMLLLQADNPAYEPIYIQPGIDDSFVFGVVLWVLFKPTIFP